MTVTSGVNLYLLVAVPWILLMVEERRLAKRVSWREGMRSLMRARSFVKPTTWQQWLREPGPRGDAVRAVERDLRRSHA